MPYIIKSQHAEKGLFRKLRNDLLANGWSSDLMI